MKLLLQLLFATILFMHIALAKLTLGLPVRTIGLLFFAGLFFIAYHRQFLIVTKRFTKVYLVFAAIAFLGISLGFLNGQEFRLVMEFLIRDAVQPLLILQTTYLSLMVLGPLFVTRVFMAFLCVNIPIVVLQYLEINAAWQIRHLMTTLQGTDLAAVKNVLREERRAYGLALTPIVFSDYLVSNYIIANLMVRNKLMGVRSYVVLTAASLAGSVANGTRSLVLGILATETFQQVARGRLTSLVWLSLAGVLVIAGYFVFSSTGARVASLQDASALGRIVLYKFGLELLYNNPMGYGWGFNPSRHAWLFWEQISHLPRANVVFRLGIHNAYLNFALQYGIFGFALIGLLAAYNIRKAWAVFTTFIAYFINAFFHNGGVFTGELHFWYAFAVFLYFYQDQEETSVAEDHLQSNVHRQRTVSSR